MAEHNNFSSFFLKTYPIPFLRICIPNIGLKSHNPAPFVFFKAALTPPPPPAKSRTYIPTFLKIQISSSFFQSSLSNPSYPTNTSNPVYRSRLTHPNPCFNNVYTQLYTSLPVSCTRLFVHLKLFLFLLQCIRTVSTWSQTKNRICIILERIRGVPRQSGGSYSRKATRMKTGNLYREIEIRLLLIA